jgi:hypothetical protein
MNGWIGTRVKIPLNISDKTSLLQKTIWKTDEYGSRVKIVFKPHINVFVKYSKTRSTCMM